MASKKEASQRLGAEILVGISRGVQTIINDVESIQRYATGSKHFAHEEAMRVNAWLADTLRTALIHLTTATVGYWSEAVTCLTENVDPRRLYWLYDVIIELCDAEQLRAATAFTQNRRAVIVRLCFVWRPAVGRTGPCLEST